MFGCSEFDLHTLTFSPNCHLPSIYVLAMKAFALLYSLVFQEAAFLLLRLYAVLG